MAQVIFVESTEEVKNKRVTIGWYVIWILAAILLAVFILRPDEFVLPSFVHSIKVTM
jgi:uncharacterized integral membrane protein